MARPEHSLQTAIKRWITDCVTEPHVFLAFDRTQASGKFTHAYEKARGIRAGTPDTQLLFRGRSMWVELKAGKNTTSDAQDELHAQMLGVGHRVRVCWTVGEYMAACQAEGVKLAQWAAARADGMDAMLAGAVAAAKAAKPKAPRLGAKPRTNRPSSRAIAIGIQSQLPGGWRA